LLLPLLLLLLTLPLLLPLLRRGRDRGGCRRCGCVVVMVDVC
jgi:hypothetical protein